MENARGIEHPEKVEGANGIVATKMDLDLALQINPRVAALLIEQVLNFNYFAEQLCDEFKQAPEMFTEVYLLSNGGFFLYCLSGADSVVLKQPIRGPAHNLRLPALSAAATLCTMFWNLMSFKAAEQGDEQKSGKLAKLYYNMTEFIFSRCEGGKEFPNAAEIWRYLD
jgi:hypothetical protein